MLNCRERTERPLRSRRMPMRRRDPLLCAIPDQRETDSTARGMETAGNPIPGPVGVF